MPEIAEIYLSEPVHDNELQQIMTVDAGRNIEKASTPASANVDLQNYYFFNSKHNNETINLAVIYAKIPSITNEQLLSMLKQAGVVGRNGEVSLFDYFYLSKNIYDDFPISLHGLLPGYCPRVMSEEEQAYHAETAEIEEFLRDNEEQYNLSFGDHL
jgi:hypothetical protein